MGTCLVGGGARGSIGQAAQVPPPLILGKSTQSLCLPYLNRFGSFKNQGVLENHFGLAEMFFKKIDENLFQSPQVRHGGLQHGRAGGAAPAGPEGDGGGARAGQRSAAPARVGMYGGVLAHPLKKF